MSLTFWTLHLGSETVSKYLDRYIQFGDESNGDKSVRGAAILDRESRKTSQRKCVWIETPKIRRIEPC